MTFPLALLLSALSGLVALSSELIWYRTWSFAAQGTASAFGALLGFYLLGLAAGSYAGGRLCGERERKCRGVAHNRGADKRQQLNAAGAPAEDSSL